MFSATRSQAIPYVAAILIVAVAAALTGAFWHVASHGALWPMFLIAVALAAWLGGLGPGLTAAAASFLAIAALARLGDRPQQLQPVDVFCTVALMLVGLFIGMLYSDRDRAREALRARDTRLQLVSNQIPGGLWSTDEHLRVTSGFGAQWPLLTGPPGTTLYRHFRTEDPAFGQIAAHRRALAGESITYELEWEHRTFQCHVEPLRDAEGRTIGVVGVASDITDRKRAEQDVQRAKHDLELANRAKDRFLAQLSHELRTPLTPVLALATALAEQSDLPPDVHSDVEVIRRNAALEVTLIDDLLDVTRIARGKLQLDFRPVDAHAVLRNAAEICRPDADAKSVTLELSPAVTDPASPRVVRADAARLQQVFWNLLKNAIKFTPAGGAVTVTSEPDPDDPARVRVSIRDTGIGIDPALLPRVFDAFEQGGADITRQFGGLGLGLAISKALVDAHNGRIAVHSDGLGKGARFTVELATTTSPAATRDPAAADPSAGGNGQSLRILLVEDHHDTAMVMRRLLRSAGHHVDTANSVRDAVAKLDASRVDLLISDLGLPDGTGLDVMREARRQGVRGIALSGFGAEDDVHRSLAAGFTAHLTKPVPMAALRHAIETARAAPDPALS